MTKQYTMAAGAIALATSLGSAAIAKPDHLERIPPKGPLKS